MLVTSIILPWSVVNRMAGIQVLCLHLTKQRIEWYNMPSTIALRRVELLTCKTSLKAHNRFCITRMVLHTGTRMADISVGRDGSRFFACRSEILVAFLFICLFWLNLAYAWGTVCCWHLQHWGLPISMEFSSSLTHIPQKLCAAINPINERACSVPSIILLFHRC